MVRKRQGFAQRRKAVGYTQESFAERVGVERTTVARWETGEAEPQPRIRPKIARALQVSVDQLDHLLTAANEPDTAPHEHLTHVLEHPSRVDLIAVARLRERVQDLDARYDRAPSTSLLASCPRGPRRARPAINTLGRLIGRIVPNLDDQAKNIIRERVWTLLERNNAVSPGVRGRIPAFFGAERAAQHLAALPVWQDAAVIKAVPDKAQLPVRVQALQEGKLVYMAVPKLAAAKPFYLLDPAKLSVPPEEAASSTVAAHIAQTISVEQMQPVDLIVCGSVAVNHHGVRLGKGAGYSDIEVALLQEAGLIGPETAIVTTVHPLQVLDEPLPETDHDFSVDLIVTTEETITSGPSRRPAGILWDHLTPDKIAAIPTLAARAPKT